MRRRALGPGGQAPIRLIVAAGAGSVIACDSKGAVHVGRGDVDADELVRWARANLSRYKCPTSYRFVDELPVAPTGKLIRRQLRS